MYLNMRNLCPNIIYKELLASCFDQVNIRTSQISWNMTLYIIELAFQPYQACSNMMFETRVMNFLIKLVEYLFRPKSFSLGWREFALELRPSSLTFVGENFHPTSLFVWGNFHPQSFSPCLREFVIEFGWVFPWSFGCLVNLFHSYFSKS
jgi:hypothetical protein